MHPLLIDTHVHLCDPVLADAMQGVLDRARQSGVGALIAVAETMEDAVRNLELAGQYPCVLPAAGLYPKHADHKAALYMRDFIRREQRQLWAEMHLKAQGQAHHKRALILARS